MDPISGASGSRELWRVWDDDAAALESEVEAAGAAGCEADSMPDSIDWSGVDGAARDGFRGWPYRSSASGVRPTAVPVLCVCNNSQVSRAYQEAVSLGELRSIKIRYSQVCLRSSNRTNCTSHVRVGSIGGTTMRKSAAAVMQFSPLQKIVWRRRCLQFSCLLEEHTW